MKKTMLSIALLTLFLCGCPRPAPQQHATNAPANASEQAKDGSEDEDSIPSSDAAPSATPESKEGALKRAREYWRDLRACPGDIILAPEIYAEFIVSGAEAGQYTLAQIPVTRNRLITEVNWCNRRQAAHYLWKMRRKPDPLFRGIHATLFRSYAEAAGYNISSFARLRKAFPMTRREYNFILREGTTLKDDELEERSKPGPGGRILR